MQTFVWGKHIGNLLPDEAILLLWLPGDDLPDELVITEDFGESGFRGFFVQHGGN